MPLAHCRRADNPKLCKADFPRTKWLTDKAVVLCHGLLRRMGMPATGRRNKLCSLHGPMNHESINATHPVLMVASGDNSDVQLPYRLPLCAETHTCPEQCLNELEEELVVTAAQVAQDAQAGYACDYCNKRQPVACNEVKEWCKGHAALAQQVAHARRNYIGKRHATRFMADAYCKGIVRSQVESTNLRARHLDTDVTRAEFFCTADTRSFFGKPYVDIVQRLNDHLKPTAGGTCLEIDARNPRKRKVATRHVSILYGQRPTNPEVWHLSPYEFVMYWDVQLLTYPRSLSDVELPAYQST